jgi:hypothetical protein
MRPSLAGSALTHILSGALLRYIWVKFFMLLGLTVMWAFAAAVGRAASLRSLISITGGDDHDEEAGWQFRPMLQLHLLRALWSWIAIGCFFASLLIGHEMMQSGRAARGAFFYVFGVAFSLVLGVMLNWIFGLAPLFCIRHQVSAREAVSLTLDFCTRQGRRLFGLSLGFLALRMGWAGAMFLLVLAPTSLGNRVAVAWVLLVMGLMFLVYLAGADALCLARLGAYAALAEIDAQPDPEPEPNPSPEPQSWAPQFPSEESPSGQPA